MKKITRKRKTPRECVENGFVLNIKIKTELTKGRKKFKVAEEHILIANNAINSISLESVYKMFAESLTERLQLITYPDYLKSKKKLKV